MSTIALHCGIARGIQHIYRNTLRLGHAIRTIQGSNVLKRKNKKIFISNVPQDLLEENVSFSINIDSVVFIYNRLASKLDCFYFIRNVMRITLQSNIDADLF